VVYDHGMWRRSDREAYKRLVEEHGGRWRLLYFKVDREVLLQRLADRNRRRDANAMPLLPADLEDFIARFDEPEGEGRSWCGQMGARADGDHRPPWSGHFLA
jgi:predicted kinase